MSNLVIQEKTVGETHKVTFDFANQLEVGESVSSASVSAAVYSGTDSTPAAILSGGPSVASPQVSQKVTGGVAGTVYVVTCLATTSAGLTLCQYGYQAVL